MAVDKKALKSWLARLREVLNRDWDPIGVVHDDAFGSDDEYDRYRDKLASMIGAHATDEELATYLEWAEREWMGLPVPPDATAHEAMRRRVISAIRALGPPPKGP
jgi:hypothetical protein